MDREANYCTTKSRTYSRRSINSKGIAILPRNIDPLFHHLYTLCSLKKKKVSNNDKLIKARHNHVMVALVKKPKNVLLPRNDTSPASAFACVSYHTDQCTTCV